MLQAHAPSIYSEHLPEAMLNANATRICTDGRTDEQTKTAGHVTSKTSLTDTCARVQEFDDFKIHDQALRAGKENR